MVELARLSWKANKRFKEVCESYDGKPINISDFQTEEIAHSVEIDEHKEFANKFELGKYLYETLQGKDAENRVWHFLVVVYFRQLLKKDGKVGEADRFFIDDTRYPRRHLLKSVYDLYCLYNDQPDLIEFLLLSSVNTSSTLFIETVKSPELMKNKNFIAACKALFYDEKNKNIKKGSSDGVERLTTLLRQYERTYDLYSMPAKKILKQLIKKHKEFDKFKYGGGILGRFF